MSELIEKSNKLLATTFAFYLKTQFFHWNVKGQDFFQYHDFFGELYGDAYGAVDQTAEQIRALDGIAYGSLTQYLSLSAIECQTTVPALQQMVSILYRDNETIITVLKEVHEAAERYNERGLVNYLEGRIDAHKKHGWMLRSSMATPVQEEAVVKEAITDPDEIKTYVLNPSEL
jgi:starvation-inducible DNA-binding protein